MQNCETMLDPQVESVSGRFYKIADRLLSVETDADWTTRLAEVFFSSLHLSPSLGHDTGLVHLRLRIMTEPPPPLPTKLQRFEVPGGVCYKDHQSYYLDVKGSTIAVGAKDSKQVRVWLGDTAVARTRASLITVMGYAIPAALRRIGLYDLHAAALMEQKSRRCFLFPGPSRSGKTSLSLRLAAWGWQYLSDDMVVISEAGDCVEARGLRRPFQTSDDSLAGHDLPRLEEALGVTIPATPEKRRLNPQILFPGQFVASAKPCMLCFPVISGECRSRLEETTKAEAMLRLIGMCPWSNYDSSAAREHLRVLGRLVRQCDTFTLHAGRDIFAEPKEANALLASLYECP